MSEYIYNEVENFTTFDKLEAGDAFYLYRDLGNFLELYIKIDYERFLRNNYALRASNGKFDVFASKEKVIKVNKVYFS